MAYLPLNNYNYDSGYKRIQSGPNHEQFIVLTSGSSAYGADNGIVVAGSPLSGTIAAGAWDYDDNWRYVPGALPSQSGSALDPTPYNVSGALDTYDGTRIATRTSVAGAQAASAIGPEANVLLPRQAPLQPRAGVTRPEKYMYFGGAAPDNQNYSPYNTPDANTAAEGKTGGPVTHRTYENTLITNVLGSQGTSDRSQWRYHQPVYCQTFTETVRSDSPGLMSTPLRYVYRGHATQYNLNYPLGNGFQQLPYDDQTGGCGIPVGCPTTNGNPSQLVVGDTLSAVVYCNYFSIEWFNSDNILLATGSTYTITTNDIGYRIYYKVTYFDGSNDTSSIFCLPSVVANSLRIWFQLIHSTSYTYPFLYSAVADSNGDLYFSLWNRPSTPFPSICKISNSVSEVWKNLYILDSSLSLSVTNNFGDSYHLIDSTNDYLEFFAWQWGTGTSWPVRIYRFKILKADGSISDCSSIDYNPVSGTSSVFAIKQVLIDEAGDYYLVGIFPDSVLNGGASIIKLASNLDFVWCRDIKGLTYRPNTSGSFCGVNAGGGSHSIYLNSKNKIVGCSWAYSTSTAYLNYFEIDLTGTVLSRFKSKFSTPDFNTDVDGFKVRSVCLDSEGFIYGAGSYGIIGQTGGTSDLIVYKESSNDTTIWATNVGATYYITSTSPNRKYVNILDNQLIVVNSKLVVVTPWSRDTVTPTYSILIFVLSTDTGSLESCIEINPPLTSGAPTDIGPKCLVQKLTEDTKILIQTSQGFRVRLDVDNLPSSGTFVCTDDGSKVYTASGLYTNQSDVTFYRFDGCGPDSAPSITSRNLSSYFTNTTPNVSSSGIAGNVFRYFGGQDSL